MVERDITGKGVDLKGQKKNEDIRRKRNKNKKNKAKM